MLIVWDRMFGTYEPEVRARSLRLDRRGKRLVRRRHVDGETRGSRGPSDDRNAARLRHLVGSPRESVVA